MTTEQIKTAVREAVTNGQTDEAVADALDKLIDHVDERLTRIEKSTGFLGGQAIGHS